MEEKMIYGQYAGNPKGTPEDLTRCREEVLNQFHGMVSNQCARKRGHGKDGHYCLMHAKRHQDRLNQKGE